jgi:putative ABC transport system permease protein
MKAKTSPANISPVTVFLVLALLLGGLGYCVAYYLGQWVFPYFPRRVVIVQEDLASLAAIIVGVSVMASVLGIVKALRVEPHEVLA